MDIEEIREIIPTRHSYKEVSLQLGYSPNDGRRRKLIQDVVQTHNIDVSHFGSSRIGSTWHDEQRIREAVTQAKSIGDLLLLLGLKNIGSNHETAKKHIQRLQLDTSHFEQTGRRDSALRKNGERRTIPLEEILEGRYPTYKTVLLKKRLFESGIKEERCEECDQDSSWNEKPLVFHLDHIDGKRDNHKLENLRILCPNCHSQTDTYAGRKR